MNSYIGSIITKERQSDLLSARMNAEKILREKGLNHVVYAYEKKSEIGITHILDWHPVQFKTDEHFEEWQKTNRNEIAMVYAVHVW